MRGPWPILIVEKGTNKEKITNDSEQDITNALIKVTRDRKKTVCFAEGEGERDIEDSGERGCSGAKGALTKSQYETKKVVLLREKKVPADCTVFVVAGPGNDLLPAAIDAIRSYVKAGGKAWSWRRARDEGRLPEPGRRSSRSGTWRRARTSWWTSRAWASSSGPAR